MLQTFCQSCCLIFSYTKAQFIVQELHHLFKYFGLIDSIWEVVEYKLPYNIGFQSKCPFCHCNLLHQFLIRSGSHSQVNCATRILLCVNCKSTAPHNLCYAFSKEIEPHMATPVIEETTEQLGNKRRQGSKYQSIVNRKEKWKAPANFDWRLTVMNNN